MFLLQLGSLLGQHGHCTSHDSLCFISKPFVTSQSDIQPHKLWEANTTFANQGLAVGDFDNDCEIELLARVYSPLNPMEWDFVVVNGKTGLVESSIPVPRIQDGQIAIADVDGDGLSELFYFALVESGGLLESRIVCKNIDGTIKWESDTPLKSGPPFHTKIVGLADFNNDSNPELYVNDEIYNARTGVKLLDAELPLLNDDYSTGVAANIDITDDNLELVIGSKVLQVSITNTDGLIGNTVVIEELEILATSIPGRTTVADIDLDGSLDVVVTSIHNGEDLVYAYTHDGNDLRLMSTLYIDDASNQFGSLILGPDQEILNMGTDSLYCLTYTEALGFEIDWSIPVESSSFVTVTFFDLDGDATEELVVRSGSDFHVYSMDTGVPELVYEIDCDWDIATVGLRGFTIADVTNNGQANICAICSDDNDNPHLTVFGSADSLSPWAPARSIWHQYNYNPLFINDDMTIPQYQKNHATYGDGKYNNFMVQENLLDEEGQYQVPAANLVGELLCVDYLPLTDEYAVAFSVENLADASLTAEAGLPISFYNGDPDAGGILLGTYTTVVDLPADSSASDLTYRIPASIMGPVYMVVNSDAVGGQPLVEADFRLAECSIADNISIYSPLPTVLRTEASVCEGSVYVYYGTALTAEGTYYQDIDNDQGCDSLFEILELSLSDTVAVELSAVSCDSYEWQDSTYAETGVYTYSTVTATGCDSVVTLSLTIEPSKEVTVEHSACDSFEWNGVMYYETGTYNYDSATLAGCDSSTLLELVVAPTRTTSVSHQACEPYLWNGTLYAESGTYVYSTVTEADCDSTVTLDLTISEQIAIVVEAQACDSFDWAGSTYTTSGTYEEGGLSAAGCDSTTTLLLTVHPSTESTTTVTACDSYEWNDSTYTDSGLYTIATINVAGCDSTAILALTISETTTDSVAITTCEQYPWNGELYTESGTYTYSGQSTAGCDSTVVLTLTLSDVALSQTDVTTCDMYEWNGTTYTESGTYTYDTLSSTGCDSIATIALVVYESATTSTSEVVCDSVTIAGTTYTESGTYSIVLEASTGCDSTVQLDLEVATELYSETVTTCAQYTWPVNGTVYTASGTYTAVYTNGAGCDSTHVLDLIVEQTYMTQLSAIACERYEWEQTGDMLEVSGVYVAELFSEQGCDSIVELTLEVLPAYLYTDTVASTAPYTWPVTGEEYTESGTYETMYESEAGCDSVHTLRLELSDSGADITHPNILSRTGVNSRFSLYGPSVAEIIKLSVYDRWGAKVYTASNVSPNDQSAGWDGTKSGRPVSAGVYVWAAHLRLTDGTTVMKYGDVTIVD